MSGAVMHSQPVNKEHIMEYLVILILTLGVTAVLSIWEGFVLMKLWGWFIVPTFGLPALTIAVAIGLALTVSFLTHQMRAKTDESSTDVAARLFGYGFANASIVLLFGWAVTLFL